MSLPLVSQDFFELGDKTALICVEPENLEPVWKTLKDLGFKTHFAESSDDVMDRLRYTPYNCIIVQENFSCSSLAANIVMSTLASMPMAQRRNSFVCLIGSSFKTLDAIQAFAQSVHVVVNPWDLPNLTAILKKGLAEFDTIYKVFRIVSEVQGDRREPARRGR